MARWATAARQAAGRAGCGRNLPEPVDHGEARLEAEPAGTAQRH